MRNLRLILAIAICFTVGGNAITQPNTDPSTAQHQFAMATHYHDQYQLPEAAAHYRQAISLNTNMENAYYNLALVYYHMNDFREAARRLEDLFDINPIAEYAYELYGLTLYHQGAYAQAIQAFGFAIENKPTTDLRLARALSHIANHDPKRALPDLDEILYQDPGHLRACLAKGAALMDLGNYHSALRFFNRVLDNDPENTEALTNRAVCHFYQNELWEMERDFQEAIIFDEDTDAVLRWAKCLLLKKNFSTAMQAVKMAIRMDGKNPAVYYLLGEIEMARSEFAKAMQSFDVALALDHTCYECLLMRGEAAAYLKNYNAAVNDFHSALRLSPQLDTARDMLRWVYDNMDLQRQGK